LTRQLERIFSTPRVDLTISWGKPTPTNSLTISNEETTILQYPSKTRAVYVGDFLTSYALFQKPNSMNSIQVSLQQRSQTIERNEINLQSKKQQQQQQQQQSSRTLHCLFAAGRLRELEDSLSSLGDPTNPSGLIACLFSYYFILFYFILFYFLIFFLFINYFILFIYLF